MASTSGPAAGGGVLQPPAPSLIGPLLPKIRATEEGLHKALLRLDDVATWDANRTNHECILQALADIARQRAAWGEAMLHSLQSSWMREVKHYNEYRLKIDHTLTLRHAAELDNFFPRLRLKPGGAAAAITPAPPPTTAKGQAPAAAGSASSSPRPSGGGDDRGPGVAAAPLTAAAAAPQDLPPEEDDAAVLAAVRQTDEHQRMAAHARKHGFGFEASNQRLLLLLQRQLRERLVLTSVSQNHAERLANAKKEDTQRLRGMLARIGQSLDAVVAKVDRKVQASRQLAESSARITGTAAQQRGGSRPASSHQPQGPPGPE